MLSGRKKKDYEAQQAADSLAAQAEALGATAGDPIPEGAETLTSDGAGQADDELEEADEEEAA